MTARIFAKKLISLVERFGPLSAPFFERRYSFLSLTEIRWATNSGAHSCIFREHCIYFSLGLSATWWRLDPISVSFQRSIQSTIEIYCQGHSSSLFFCCKPVVWMYIPSFRARSSSCLDPSASERPLPHSRKVFGIFQGLARSSFSFRVIECFMGLSYFCWGVNLIALGERYSTDSSLIFPFLGSIAQSFSFVWIPCRVCRTGIAWKGGRVC